jgi:hypothetical protein
MEIPPKAQTIAEPTARLCAICQSPLGEDEPSVSCPVCQAPYHADCWEENGGCAVYGCSAAPRIEPRSSLDIPPAYWGRENKSCPRCNQEILAAAVRCRHCGATFESAQPEDAASFHQRAALGQALPEVRRRTIWLFCFAVLPFTAPLAALYMAFWYPSHRPEIEALPAFYGGLCRLALFIATGQTIVFVLMGILFSIFRGH